MTIILFIVGLLLIALGWHMQKHASEPEDSSGLGGVFSMFVGGVFVLIALLSWAYHWMHS